MVGWLNDNLVAEVRAVWDDLLKTVPPTLVSRSLSAPTREFLTNVGLPTVEASEFAPVRDDIALGSAFLEGREYVTVTDGITRDYRFAVDVASDEVFYLQDGTPGTWLVNSNLGLFVLFVGKYYRDVLNLPVQDEESLQTGTFGVWRSLSILDPPAAGDECWWSPTLYEIASEYG